MDNNNELLPIVDKNGKIMGKIRRGEAHNGAKILHPVVHLHVFSADGSIYLQKRPIWKDVQQGKWDTAVGGHVCYGEDIETALRREANEELNISNEIYKFLGHYVFESDVERELIYVYKTAYLGRLYPNEDELDGGRFWSAAEIISNIGKDVFTPNFEFEYAKFFVEDGVL